MTSVSQATDGYLNDQPWAFGYSFKLSPHYLRLALAFGGREAPAIARYCELAFGHGVSLVIHAAANPSIRFAGTDFNPLHASFARELAGDDVPNLWLSGLSFADFFGATRGGPFDAVAMVGTWSWLPETEQRNILGFLREGLRAEGIFCHDNMVLPGNAATSALRQMLTSFATLDPPARPGSAERALPAVKRAIQLMDANPNFVNLFADARETLDLLLKETSEHLAHEYFNYNWTARHFVETAHMMREAGLSFTSPWSLKQASSALQFTARQKSFLATIGSAELREQVKDYIQCRSIRYDIWSRKEAGKGLPSALEYLEETRLIPAKPIKDFDWVASGSAGEFDLDRAAFGPVIDLLGGGEPVSMGALRKAAGQSLVEQDLLMLVGILVDDDWVRPVQPDPAEIDAARAACRAVNSRILALQAEGKPLRALASPVTGSGIEVPREHFVFLRARQAGATSPPEYAQFAVAEPSREPTQAPLLVQRTPESFLAAAREFESHALPIYRKLLVDEG